MSIRAAREEDIPEILSIYTPYVINTAYSFEYTPPTQEEFLARFREYTQQFPWLVWEEQGKVLGYAYASAPWKRAAYSWCAEASIYLSPEIQGKGVGKKLYALLEEILTRQGYRTVYAVITSENRNSVEFHKAVGYTDRAEFPNCGYKLGRWLGVIWLEKNLNLLENPGEFPAKW